MNGDFLAQVIQQDQQLAQVLGVVYAVLASIAGFFFAVILGWIAVSMPGWLRELAKWMNKTSHPTTVDTEGAANYLNNLRNK